MNNKMVVGSQARILYADAEGRSEIALAFNAAIKEGKLSGPVALSRDHHDVSGTDSPFRETSNITDGSMFLADMAINNVIGDACRGATWVAIHNGGGVGWGEVVNGGFGLVLDGSDRAHDNAKNMLFWDVNNGVARRCWSGNENARLAITNSMDENKGLQVTVPQWCDKSVLDAACSSLEATFVQNAAAGDDSKPVARGGRGRGRGRAPGRSSRGASTAAASPAAPKKKKEKQEKKVQASPGSRTSGRKRKVPSRYQSDDEAEEEAHPDADADGAGDETESDDDANKRPTKKAKKADD